MNVHPATAALIGTIVGIAIWVPAAIAGTARANASSTDHTVTVHMRQCAHEDGNEDGQPCAWVDPDTGDAYIVTSEAYR